MKRLISFIIRQTTVEHEVACLDVSPLWEEEMASVVAVGLWTDISARVLALPTLEENAKEFLGGGKHYRISVEYLPKGRFIKLVA